MSRLKNKNLKQNILFGTAIVLIIFSFFAPFVFTRPGLIDFTNSGQIGDTIGGLMNPFIAIAGVIAAFLAFWMQKQANDIIVNQFNDKMAYDDNLEKIKKDRIVELMISDVKFVQKDIEVRTNAIITFLNEIKDNPFQTRVLIRTPVSSYIRMGKVNRESLFDALVFRGTDDTVKTLDAFYSIPDYMIPALNHILRITDSFESVVYEGLNFIKNTTAEIIKICIDRELFNTSLFSCFKEFQNDYHRAHDSSMDRFFYVMKDKYIKLEQEVSKLVADDLVIPEHHHLRIIQEYLRQIESTYYDIEQQSNQISHNMSDAIEGLNTISKRCESLLSRTESKEQ